MVVWMTKYFYYWIIALNIWLHSQSIVCIWIEFDKQIQYLIVNNTSIRRMILTESISEHTVHGIGLDVRNIKQFIAYGVPHKLYSISSICWKLFISSQTVLSLDFVSNTWDQWLPERLYNWEKYKFDVFMHLLQEFRSVIHWIVAKVSKHCIQLTWYRNEENNNTFTESWDHNKPSEQTLRQINTKSISLTTIQYRSI